MITVKNTTKRIIKLRKYKKFIDVLLLPGDNLVDMEKDELKSYFDVKANKALLDTGELIVMIPKETPKETPKEDQKKATGKKAADKKD